MSADPGPGTIYTETIVHSAPQRFVQDAPYQLVIVTLDAGPRMTARVMGDPVAIGDRVEFAGFRDGVPFFRRAG